GQQLPPVTSPTREDVLAEMNPHVWLQASVDGRWIDLDPSFSDAAVGAALTTADRTGPDLPLGIDMRARVQILDDRVAHAVLTRTALFDWTFKPVDPVDKQCFLFHSPGLPGNPMGGLGAALAGSLSGRRPELWTPMLWIDGQLFSGETIDVTQPSPAFVAER